MRWFFLFLLLVPFASSYNGFSDGVSLSVVDRTVTVNDDAIFYQGWYSANAGDWVSFTFPDAQTSGWILDGDATKMLPDVFVPGGEHYVLVYSCSKGSWTSTDWSCHGGQWQILQFSVEEKVTETCDDEIMNQGELGVDCGGPCAACALPSPVGSCDGRIIIYENNMEQHNLGSYTKSGFQDDWNVYWGVRWKQLEIYQETSNTQNPTNVLKIDYPHYDNDDPHYYCWSNGISEYYYEPPTCNECPRHWKSGSGWKCGSNGKTFDYEPSCSECPTQYSTTWGVGSGSGGASWTTQLPSGPEHGGYKELYFSYKIRFGPGFNPVSGGKIPGLCGTDGESSCPGGGTNTLNSDGDAFRFSARMMFNQDNYRYYLYYPDRNGAGTDTGTGASQLWDGDIYDGQWHTIVQRVVLSDLNSHNGVLEGWLDGKRVTAEGNYRFRMGEEALFGLNHIHFSTFFGGSDTSTCENVVKHQYMAQECAAGEIWDWTQPYYDLCAVDPTDPCSDILRYSDGSPFYYYAPRKDEVVYFDDFVVYYYDSSASVTKGNSLSSADRVELPPPVGNRVVSGC